MFILGFKRSVYDQVQIHALKFIPRKYRFNNDYWYLSLSDSGVYLYSSSSNIGDHLNVDQLFILTLLNNQTFLHKRAKTTIME